MKPENEMTNQEFYAALEILADRANTREPLNDLPEMAREDV